MDELRIAMLSVHTCPLATLGGKKTGGMNVYVRELSAELSRRGIYVDVFTRSQDPCVPHIDSSTLGDRARVIHVPAGPEAPMSTSEIYDYVPEFVENVREFARSQNITYDIIHSHYWLSGLAANELRKSWHAPVIHMFHTLGHMKNRIAQDAADHESDTRIQAETQIMNKVDRLIAATPAERIQMMWLYGADMKKIRIISPGVDVNHFVHIPRADARAFIGVPEDDKMLLFVGRIERLKGVDTLLNALAILRENKASALEQMCLTVVGGAVEDSSQEDREMTRLRRLEAELGLSDLVTFLGAKDQETLQYYYSAAEAVVMPSHYESFGMVALEAMACGTPVIASEVGGLAYLIQDGITGFHVPANDPEELAGKINLILNNEKLRREMSQFALEYAQNYSWSNIAEQILQLYNSSLGRTTPARQNHWSLL